MADLMEIEIERPQQLEATALGAAYLAGLKTGYWKSMDDIKLYRKTEKTFQRKQINPQIEENYIKWKKAIERSFNWG
jgi:glycerol kinase